MATEEFRPDVGKKLFAEHQSDLLQALGQLADALGHDHANTGLSQFFSRFMRGFWDPYEEVCTVSSKQQVKTTEEIRALEGLLKAKLPPRPLFAFQPIRRPAGQPEQQCLGLCLPCGLPVRVPVSADGFIARR